MESKPEPCGFGGQWPLGTIANVVQHVEPGGAGRADYDLE